MNGKEISLLGNERAGIFYYRASPIKLIRPMTLTGTIGPVLIGTGFAKAAGVIRYDMFIAFLIAALLIQAAVNIFNDYYDFKYGQDQEKWITAEEADLEHKVKHQQLPLIAGILLLAALIPGTWIAMHVSLWMIPAGVISVFAGYRYSAGTHSFASIGLGEVIAAVFLGPVVTVLAYISQGQALDMPVFFISLPIAAIISSMILTNNIRDLKKDQKFRITLAIKLGRRKAAYLLAGIITFAYAAVLLLIFLRQLPLQTFIVLLALPAAGRLLWSLRQKASRLEEGNGMKWAAWHHWLFGLLLAVSIWLFG